MTEEVRYKLIRAVKFAVIIAAAAALGVFLGHFMTSYETRFMLSREYCGSYKGIEIYKTGDIDTDNFTSHAEMLGKAPDKLLEGCQRLYFTGTDLDISENETGINSALGLTQDRTVYISTRSFGADVLYHELFHAYDNYNGMPSLNSDEFKKAYDAEKGSVFIAVVDRSHEASEFFAQTGAMYLISPKELQFRAPMTFGYFNGIFGLF